MVDAIRIDDLTWQDEAKLEAAGFIFNGCKNDPLNAEKYADKVLAKCYYFTPSEKKFVKETALGALDMWVAKGGEETLFSELIGE